MHAKGDHAIINERVCYVSLIKGFRQIGYSKTIMLSLSIDLIETGTMYKIRRLFKYTSHKTSPQCFLNLNALIMLVGNFTNS